MADLSQFNIRNADWRKQIALNKKRTRRVIFIFITLYAVIGLILDTLIYLHIYPAASTAEVFQALITFQIFPYATLIMGIIAALSLWITYSLYDKVMLLGTEYYQVRLGRFRDLKDEQLYNVVEEMKVAAGLNFMPKVFVINAPYMNAFASGYSERSAMVAITQGLLDKLDRNELQAVMAHELSHIRHQDIKLTLTASVLSNILLIAVDLIFYKVAYGRKSNVDNRLMLIIVILRYALPLVTVLLFLYLSRTREYMADAGCVELMRDNQPLASALLKIHQDHQQNLVQYREAYGKTAHEDVRRAAYLYDPVSTGVEPVKSLFSGFSTHPSLQERLEALGFKGKPQNES